MSGFDLFCLNGKVALVTGCKRGIGKAMAIALAQAGADIVGVSKSLEKNGSDVEKEIVALGRRFKGYSCDFADRTALREFIGCVQSNHSQIDILVNIAGHILRSPAIEHPEHYWDEILEINLSAQFFLAQAIGKRMLENSSGKIVFIASLLTFQGGITVPGYAASKGAIGQLTKALSNEWASGGAQVNAIAPGCIATDNTFALRADENRCAAILDRIPAGDGENQKI